MALRVPALLAAEQSRPPLWLRFIAACAVSSWQGREGLAVRPERLCTAVASCSRWHASLSPRWAGMPAAQSALHRDICGLSAFLPAC